MSSPFMSTRSVASRRRQRPVVERATFVVASIGGTRVALPVEQVERVVRPVVGYGDASVAPLTHQGRPLALHDLARLLGAPVPAPAAAGRVLVVPAVDGRGAFLGVQVDQVYEVLAIDTSLIQPVGALGDCPFAHAAVRGQFRQGDVAVWVIDATRLVNDA